MFFQIKKEYGNNVVPAFPPKKIFTLTPAEVDQRREQLEKYMQAGEKRLLLPEKFSIKNGLVAVSSSSGLVSPKNDTIYF